MKLRKTSIDQKPKIVLVELINLSHQKEKFCNEHVERIFFKELNKNLLKLYFVRKNSLFWVSNCCI